MQLVYYTNGVSKEPFTLSTVIAECAKVQHRTVQRLIKKHKKSLERFGKVRFQITPSNSGQNIKAYELNEPQATLLITFMRNTDKVIEFKENLVKAFYELRKEVYQLRLARELEKPKRRQLTDAIQAWPHVNQWSYKQFTDLLLKEVTGMNAKQLKAHHGSESPSLDLLTLDQHQAYYDLENKVIVLIDLGLTYQEIKEMIQGKENVTV